MSKMIDLTGRVFGKLTVIRPAGSNKCGQKLWECECECGGKTVSASSSLLRGTSRSCGCLAHPVKGMIGQKFGKLTVIDRAEKKPGGKKRAVWWLCRCDCSRETIVDGASLRSGNTQSCGNCSWGSYEFRASYVIGHFVDDAVMLIDYADYPQVRQHRWWIDKGSGYFVTNIAGHFIPLHNFLMTPPKGMVCDHINRDKHDNRRRNLRYATPKENSRNRSKGRNNTTGYIGVSWHIRQKKYTAQVKVDNRTLNLGCFDSAEEAARVRDRAALYYFGEFANLNFGGDANEAANTQVGAGLYAADIAV